MNIALNLYPSPNPFAERTAAAVPNLARPKFLRPQKNSRPNLQFISPLRSTIKIQQSTVCGKKTSPQQKFMPFPGVSFKNLKISMLHMN
jgi:hypothetical protein